jgi:predicted nuclease of predicted toxin-antitoxin system
MRILIDECLPKQLTISLANKHETTTVQDAGWANVKNGELLRLANDAAFDVFVTADKNMYYQQSFAGLRISAVVIPSNRKMLVQKSVPALLQSLEHVQPGQKVEMDLGSDTDVWETMKLRAVEHREYLPVMSLATAAWRVRNHGGRAF